MEEGEARMDTGGVDKLIPAFVKQEGEHTASSAPVTPYGGAKDHIAQSSDHASISMWEVGQNFGANLTDLHGPSLSANPAVVTSGCTITTKPQEHLKPSDIANKPADVHEHPIHDISNTSVPELVVPLDQSSMPNLILEGLVLEPETLQNQEHTQPGQMQPSASHSPSGQSWHNNPQSVMGPAATQGTNQLGNPLGHPMTTVGPGNSVSGLAAMPIQGRNSPHYQLVGDKPSHSAHHSPSIMASPAQPQGMGMNIPFTANNNLQLPVLPGLRPINTGNQNILGAQSVPTPGSFNSSGQQQFSGLGINLEGDSTDDDDDDGTPGKRRRGGRSGKGAKTRETETKHPDGRKKDPRAHMLSMENMVTSVKAMFGPLSHLVQVIDYKNIQCKACQPEAAVKAYSAYHTACIRKHFMRHHQDLLTTCEGLDQGKFKEYKTNAKLPGKLTGRKSHSNVGSPLSRRGSGPSDSLLGPPRAGKRRADNAAQIIAEHNGALGTSFSDGSMPNKRAVIRPLQFGQDVGTPKSGMYVAPPAIANPMMSNTPVTRHVFNEGHGAHMPSPFRAVGTLPGSPGLMANNTLQGLKAAGLPVPGPASAPAALGQGKLSSSSAASGGTLSMPWRQNVQGMQQGAGPSPLGMLNNPSVASQDNAMQRSVARPAAAAGLNTSMGNNGAWGPTSLQDLNVNAGPYVQAHAMGQGNNRMPQMMMMGNSGQLQAQGMAQMGPYSGQGPIQNQAGGPGQKSSGKVSGMGSITASLAAQQQQGSMKVNLGAQQQQMTCFAAAALAKDGTGIPARPSATSQLNYQMTGLSMDPSMYMDDGMGYYEPMYPMADPGLMYQPMAMPMAAMPMAVPMQYAHMPAPMAAPMSAFAGYVPPTFAMPHPSMHAFAAPQGHMMMQHDGHVMSHGKQSMAMPIQQKAFTQGHNNQQVSRTTAAPSNPQGMYQQQQQQQRAQQSADMMHGPMSPAHSGYNSMNALSVGDLLAGSIKSSGNFVSQIQAIKDQGGIPSRGSGDNSSQRGSLGHVSNHAGQMQQGLSDGQISVPPQHAQHNILAGRGSAPTSGINTLPSAGGTSSLIGSGSHSSYQHTSSQPQAPYSHQNSIDASLAPGSMSVVQRVSKGQHHLSSQAMMHAAAPGAANSMQHAQQGFADAQHGSGFPPGTVRSILDDDDDAPAWGLNSTDLKQYSFDALLKTGGESASAEGLLTAHDTML